MALITCTECGASVSDKAKACPECGCPCDYIIKATCSDNICVECGVKIPSFINTRCPECGCPIGVRPCSNPNNDFGAKNDNEILDLSLNDEVNEINTEATNSIKTLDDKNSTIKINVTANTLVPILILSICIVLIGLFLKYKYDEVKKSTFASEMTEKSLYPEIIVQPSYDAKNRLDHFDYTNSTALDIQNHLMWTIDANLSAEPLTFKKAIEFVSIYNNNQYSGFNNWRLPFKRELLGLIKYSEQKSPAYFFNSHGFKNVMLSTYWAVTDTESAKPMMIDMNSGLVDPGSINKCYIWLVRDTATDNPAVVSDSKTKPEHNTDAETSHQEAELREVIVNYFKNVEKGNIDEAIKSYAESVQRKVSRRSLEAISQRTLNYSINSMSFETLSESKSSVRVGLIHKLTHGRAEYWDVVINLINEDNKWKIVSTPGKFVRYE